MGQILTVAWVYGLLALDHIAVGQFMLSRPLVVGPLLGWCLGNAPLGLLAGASVEMFWVHPIPVGHWPIDPAAVAALSITWCQLSSHPGRGTLTLCLLLAIPCGIVVRHLDIWFRRQNSRFIPWVSERLERGNEGALGGAVALS
ncbi:MAG TPA: PTS sugar transporter subunit IIC, partial [Elusimicrobiota bacterium]|nr:PTS sugar transporter subunit IIC [Elusimicrobiota bacterium]